MKTTSKQKPAERDPDDLIEMMSALGSQIGQFIERKRSEKCQQGGSLTRQLLAFSRRQALIPKPLDLNQSIAEMENMLRRLIGEDVELKVVHARDLGIVEADPGQIQQVLMNLVVNARDAMPNGGKLIIETANEGLDDEYASRHPGAIAGRYVLMTITDTGLGMDEATIGRIFEPFFTTKEEGKGTGLGLSTVYGIVKQSGGYITVHSQMTQGTTIKIYLPRVDQPTRDGSPAPSEVWRERDIEGNQETILLVDDNDSVRTAIASFLFLSGYTEEAIRRDGLLSSNSSFLSKPVTLKNLMTRILELLA